MSILDSSSYVLRPSRSAGGNSSTTDEATTGVDRDHLYPEEFPPAYVVKPTDGPVEPYGDMYRAAVLLQPSDRAGKQEYCLFAATTGSLSTIEDPSFVVTGGSDSVQVIPGSLSVGGFEDGTTSFYIRDEGARDVSSVISIIVVVGGTSVTDAVTCTVTSYDALTGRVGIDASGIGGGYSEERGDSIFAAHYVLAGVSFWWTRNDTVDGVSRFGWNGKVQKWLPLPGTPARSLGAVDPDEDYTLNPAPTRFEIGDTLPGDPSEGDQYALLRVGLYSDKDSAPLEVRVVSDEIADAGWDGGGGDAIVGVNSGLLVLSPSFVEVNAGRTLWYNAETFVPDADGDMGVVADFPTVDNQGFPSLSPAPGPTERPFLRIGNRQYLTPIPKEDDNSLSSPSGVPSGYFEWSKTTGKIVLSAVDIAKCTPGFSTAEGDPADYEIPYLGARLFFDGVALSTQPIPVRGPSYCIDAEGDGGDGSLITGDPDGVPTFGDLFVDRAKPLPPPGVSGVSWVPDNSGVVPDGATVPVPDPPQTRPNGTGLVRQVKAEAGDTFFFNGNTGGSGYAYENVDTIEYDEDITKLKFRIPKTDVEVARQSKDAPSNYPYSSRINMRRRPVKGDSLLFKQAMVIPSVYSDTARVYSRFMGPYQLDGTETLRYALDGTEYLWTAPGSGSYTASDIAASFPAGHAGHQRGILYLEDPSGTDIEIGWHLPESSGGPPRGRFELSAHAALGLLPGWKIVAGDSEYRWLPDNGAALGVFRSPTNLDRNDPTPDIRARSVLKNKVLTDNIPAVPFITINQPPLEDIPGYEEDSHFRVRSGLLRLNLKNYQTIRDVGLKYDWPNDRMQWIREGQTNSTEIAFPSSVLQLADTGVLPETVSSDAMLDGAFGLDLKSATDNSFSELIQGTEFLMPGEGNPGQAFLVEVAGETEYQGGNGTFVAGGTLFSDPNTTIGSVPAGYLLHIINGDAEGVYTFTDSFLNVSPAFPASGGSTYGAPPAQWRIYEAKTRGEVDNTLLADVQQTVQNHFSEEPFKIRLLTYAGDVGSTLTVNPSDAIRSGRIVRVRFGLESGSPEAVPSYLVRGTDLGPVATDGIFVDPTDPHVSNSGATVYFQIRVGAEVYVPTVNGGGGLVDVDTTTGEVSIDPNVVSDQTGSSVFYDQIFLSPSDLSAGECEIDSSDGSVNLSGADTSSYSGAKAYFVEQMVTENNLDVTTSPLNGSLLFNKPLRAMQIVEVNYFQADTNGDKALDSDGNEIEVTEFLPLVVRLETATRIDGYTYSYNPTGRTESSTVEPFMWVGVELQNFAGVTNAVANEGTITFTNEVSETDTVQINYGVLEAFGGEQAYTVSTPPVYRKPFWIDAESSSFPLQSDKTSVFEAGDLVLVGETPLYVTGSSYDAPTDQTTVSFFPTTQGEVGSRAVGRDVSLTVSDFKVAVDYGGDEGFMPTLNTDAITGTPLQPADRGQLEVSFYGDVRAFTRASHILEIDGYPYLIISSSQSADGRNTVVTVGTPLYKDHDNSQKVRVSVRPVYTPGPTEFVGLGPLVPTEEFDLFLMGRTDSSGNPIPGKNLIEGVHYTLDPTTGSVVFQSPTQEPLQAGEYLHFRYTKLVEVAPEIVDGALLYPLYKSKYLAVSTPSSKNGILGKVLRAKYTYRNQDSFFFEVLPLLDYLPEVESASSSQGITPIGGGAVPSTPGETPLNKQGRFGLRGETHDYLDQDRAARAYVEFFNGVILAFEQILEALDGRIIGDRDGKFKFFIGRGKRYSRPGWENQMTGKLVPNLVWRKIVNSWSPDSFGGWYNRTDPVFNPTTAEGSATDPALPGNTDGTTPDPETLNFFVKRQRRRVKNDMDDWLLVGFARPRFFAALFPWMDVPGKFKQMWEDHPYSRLYPERTKHFTRLFPGLEPTFNSEGQITDPGYYSSGRKITVPGPEPGEETEQKVKTRNSTIGVIANPAIGNITNIIDVDAQDRLPRARVWAFYPEGSEALEKALDDFFDPDPNPYTVTGRAVMVATPLPLSEFPTNPDNGFPDFSQLLSSDTSGSLSSLESGDAELSTPAFESGQRVDYGIPSDIVYGLSDTNGNGVFVDEVLVGCILTFKDFGESPLNGNNILANGSTPVSEKASDNDGYGDTVFVVPPVYDIDDLPGEDTELTLGQNQKVVGSIPDYRIQFDLKVRRKSGEFRDNSLPTKDDIFPLPLQDWFGQNPPSPTSCIEGVVEFANTDSEPLKLPCLLGEDKDDSGDNQIPYIRSTNTELTVLGRVADVVESVFVVTDVALPIPASLPSDEQQTWTEVYPDEIRITDGELFDTSIWDGYPKNVSALYTSTECEKIRKFDLVFVQAPQPSATIPGGATGILSVGRVNTSLPGTPPAGTSTIEPPRFVAQTELGTRHRYTIRGFNAHLGGGTSGIRTTEAANPNYNRVTWDFSSVPNTDLSGLGGGVLGGNRTLVIRYYDPTAGIGVDPFIGAVVIPSVGIGTTIYAYNQSTGVSNAYNLSILGSGVQVPGPFSITADIGTLQSILVFLGLTSGDEYDYSLDFDTYIDPVTEGFTGGLVGQNTGPGTFACTVLRDRLTFVEQNLDFTEAQPRFTHPSNGDTNYELGLQLALHEVELNGVAVTVNSPAEINGAPPPGHPSFGVDYLTFLERIGESPDGSVGNAVPYVGTPTGQIQLMAWEGFKNTPMSPQERVKFSLAPTSDAGETDIILEYAAADSVIQDGNSDTTPQSLGAVDLEGNRNYVLFDPASTPTNGDIDNVEKNDLLIVDSGTSGSDQGAVKEGAYLIRHKVKGDGTYSTSATSVYGERRLIAATQSASSQSKPFALAGSDGMLDLSFPTVVSASSPSAFADGSITLRGVKPVPGSPTGHGWASSGAVHLIFEEKYCEYSADAYGSGSSGWEVNADSVWSTGYNALGPYDPDTETLVLKVNATAGLLTYARADGSIGVGNGWYAAAAGKKASGMAYFSIGQLGPHMPENNVVGPDTPFVDGSAKSAMAGWYAMTVRNMLPGILLSLDTSVANVLPKEFITTSSNLQNNFLAESPAGARDDNLIIGIPVPKDNTEFYEDNRESVYGRMAVALGNQDNPVAGVATYIDISKFDSSLTAGTWYEIRFGNDGGLLAYAPTGLPVSNLSALGCLLPGDKFVAGTSIDPDDAASFPGFFALEGLFLEPSFPRPVNDLNHASPAVVDTNNSSLSVNDIGPRDYSEFSGGAALEENVRIFVRRLRRWHEAQNAVVTGLDPLRFVYEIRRGDVDAGSTTALEFTAATGGAGTTYGFDKATNLGDFDNKDININPGDTLRIIDPNTGEVTDTAEVDKVVSGSVLKLSSPGLTEDLPTDAVFEVYLEQAIIPHEQSNEQLFNLVADETVIRKVVSPTYTSGTDGGYVATVNELSDGSEDLTVAQEGDYVVVDPAGALYSGTERGARPEGDTSYPGRPEHSAGAAAPLDDNRGFYRVSEVSGSNLVVTGESRFSDGSNFGGDSGAEYVVLPVVNGGAEGQQDLRETAEPVEIAPGDFSFISRTGLDYNKSIQPFSYRIIRPNPVFSQDSVELVLFIRERMLSWIEEISSSYGKGGYYYDFQKFGHIRDTGTAGSALSGLGVLSDAFVDGIIGLTSATPFANTADCLSILDRRFWILDFRLDSLPKGASPTYTQFADDEYAQRPVLPDLIEEVLNLDDKFRDQRYSWISFRANRTDGSIRTAKRAENSLESRLRKQREAINRSKGLKKS